MSRLVLALAVMCLTAACRDTGSTAPPAPRTAPPPPERAAASTPTAPAARTATVALSATAAGALPSFVVHLTGTPGLAFGGWCEGATAQGSATT